jgi:ABC-type dipeptide/oligopeptide/nickel transport system permease component
LLRLLIRRLVVGLPAVLAVVLVTFMMVRLSGESPVHLLAGPNASPLEISSVTATLGLDRSLWDQLVIYVGRLLRGDLGVSWMSGQPVLSEVIDRLPATLELVFLSMLLGGALGVWIGCRAAFRPGGAFDTLAQTAATVTFSIPIYVVGLLAILLFFVALDVAPAPMGRLGMAVMPPDRVTGSHLLDALIAGDLAAVRSAASLMVLPVLCFSLVVAGPTIKQVRGVVAEALNSDYAAYARACGLPQVVVRRIALRNSLVPIVTFLGTEFSHLFAASSLIELTFAWGGLGQYGLNAILQGDFAAVQGYVLVLAIASLIVFFLVDLFVWFVEPRAKTA